MSYNYSTFENLNTLFTAIGNKLRGKQNTLVAGNGINIEVGTSSDRISTDVPLSVVNGKVCITYDDNN